MMPSLPDYPEDEAAAASIAAADAARRTRRKPSYPIKPALRDYLTRFRRDLALPVSLRSRDADPIEPRVIEATTEGLRLDGELVIPLSNGKVAPADRALGILAKLESRLQSPARAR